MRLCLFAMVLSVFVVGTAAPRCWAAEPENLFKNAAVGDWAAYKIATTGPNADQPQPLKPRDGEWKLTVSAKGDKQVTLKTNVPQTPRVPPDPDIKIELNKGFDPTRISNYVSWFTPEPKSLAPSEEKTKEGDKETIEVGKTKYECKVVTITRTYKVAAKNAEGTYEYKLWTCPDAPMGGLVKMEGKYSTNFGHLGQFIIMLQESGKKE
jgi:hypothetical protein